MRTERMADVSGFLCMWYGNKLSLQLQYRPVQSLQDWLTAAVRHLFTSTPLCEWFRDSEGKMKFGSLERERESYVGIRVMPIATRNSIGEAMERRENVWKRGNQFLSRATPVTSQGLVHSIGSPQQKPPANKHDSQL